MNIISSSDSRVGRHIRNYRDQLNSGNPVLLSSLVSTFVEMGPLLHREAGTKVIDIAALNYSVTRLPPETFKLQKVVISPNISDFARHGVDSTTSVKVSTRNRRRVMYLNPDNGVLCCLLNSDSDIDDIVNLLLMYFIELGKLQSQYNGTANLPENVTEIFLTDSSSLQQNLNSIHFDPEIFLYSYPSEYYQNNCHQWWQDVVAKSLYLGLKDCPVYFVSSNSHSLINIIGGFVGQRQNYIIDFIAKNHPKIYQQWFDNKVKYDQSQINDFLFYLSNSFLNKNQEFRQEKLAYEKNLGVINITSNDYFPADVQIIPVRSILKSTNLDPNIKVVNSDSIVNSNAIIVNIQYPLGIAAKYLMDEILNFFNSPRGVYIIGKAAIISGSVGDFQIPSTVLDEPTNNTFQFKNIFNEYYPFTHFISQVFKNQKATCVYGTLLENKDQIENYQKTGFNIIEMESSNFLTAITQKYILNNQPIGRSFYYNLDQLPLDLGIINYASDKPLVQNLGEEGMNFKSIETTYTSALTVLQRIIDLESTTR